MKSSYCMTFTAILALTILTGEAHGSKMPDDIVFYDLDDKIAQWKEVAVSIEAYIGLEEGLPKWTIVGSGFLVSKITTFVVTNEHVIAGIDSFRVGVNTNQGKKVVPAIPIIQNPDLDIAILHAEPPPGIKIEQKSVGFSQFEMAPQVGMGVITVGYPLGLGEEVNRNYPISRIGIIAQFVPRSPIFLIDGIASHGNSGSAVFSTKNLNLLGMIKGFMPDTIDAYDGEHRLIARLPYNSGLAVAISAPIIKSLFDSISVREDVGGRIIISFPQQAP